MSDGGAPETGNGNDGSPAGGRATPQGGRSAVNAASSPTSDDGSRGTIGFRDRRCLMMMTKTLSRHGRHADHH